MADVKDSDKKVNTERAVLRVEYNPKIKNFTRSMKVQFNPSTLTWKSTAASYQQSNVGGEGKNQINQSPTPAKTTLSFDLVFDKVDEKDAFTARTISSALPDTGKLIAEATKYSVQDEVEGLLGIVLSEDTRYVQFVWGDMTFAGEVSSVKADYTMFNPKGNPIRAKVSLSIVQKANPEEVKKGVQDSLDKTLEKSFDKIFEENSAVGKGFGEKMKSLLNGVL